jgi:hypothetical protein
MKFLGTVVHNMTNYCRTIANIDEIFIIIIYLNNISLRYNEKKSKSIPVTDHEGHSAAGRIRSIEKSEKLRKLIRNTLTLKQKERTCYFC